MSKAIKYAFILSLWFFTNPAFAADESKSSDSSDDTKLTYDLGVSSGSFAGTSYAEAELGLNYYFVDYMAWRNAVFYRFQSGIPNAFGIDTSLRGVLALGNRALGFTAFAGPGFRFINKGYDAPFAEAGAAIKVAGLSIGAGVKSIFNSIVDRNVGNDTQVFLILAGSGSL